VALFQSVVTQAVMTNPLISMKMMPRQLYPPILSRYQPGMTYGWHTDAPIMGQQPPIRTDVAMTLFLNDPDSYDGGELELQSPTGLKIYKLKRGDAVLYPCTQIHRVREVTRGERVAAVTWIQSLIPDPAKREIIFGLGTAHTHLSEKEPNSSEVALIAQAYSNLLRMWINM